jgi:hypothetical protein
VLAPIIKEIRMFRKNSLQPPFDSFESVVLLSPRAARSSSSLQTDNAQGFHLELNGTLHGNKTVLILDTGAPLAVDSQIIGGSISYFDTSGRLNTLGKVSGSFGPNKATDFSLGQLPNLSNLTLDLSNHAGSVELTLSPSTTNRYQFKVAGGAGSYADAHGSGSLTISLREGSNDYLLVLKSIKR